MHCPIVIVGLIAVSTLPLSLLAEEGRIRAPGAKIQRLAEGFKFTEGPAADSQGNVFFTDQPNNRILKWSVEGRLSTWRQPCGRANGLCFDRGGNLWACADENNELWCIDPKGKVTVAAREYQGRRLNGPNDVWISSTGGAYFIVTFEWIADKASQPWYVAGGRGSSSGFALFELADKKPGASAWTGRTPRQ